jgi:hypothetical protein
MRTGQTKRGDHGLVLCGVEESDGYVDTFVESVGLIHLLFTYGYLCGRKDPWTSTWTGKGKEKGKGGGKGKGKRMSEKQILSISR